MTTSTPAPHTAVDLLSAFAVRTYASSSTSTSTSRYASTSTPATTTTHHPVVETLASNASDALLALLTSSWGGQNSTLNDTLNVTLPQDYNCTHGVGTYAHFDFYDMFSCVLLGYVNFWLILAGFVANLVSIRIFSHPSMNKSSINWYLIGISVSGALLLLSSFFFMSLPRLGERIADPWGGSPFKNHWGIVTFSTKMAPFFMSLGNVGQTGGIYMTIAMSAHRFIGVCFPFKAGEILPHSRVKKIIFGVVCFAILFNITRFFEVVYVKDCYYGDVGVWLPQIGRTKLRLQKWYMMAFQGWSYTLVMFIVPFVSLSILNSRVIMAVRHSRKMHAGMTGGGMGGPEEDAAKKQELQKEIRTSVMLVGIVIVFLCCNSLALVVNILETGFQTVIYGDPSVVHPPQGWNLFVKTWFPSLVVVSNFLVTLNAGVNIFVYCLFSEKFRLLLHYYARCQWCREGEMVLNLNDNPYR